MTSLLFRNGSALLPDGRRTHAVAARGHTIVAIGDDALAAGGTDVDLAGGLLIPAFRDGHAHPLWGGIDLGRLPLTHCRRVEDIVAIAGTYATSHPDLDWIVGGPYEAAVLPGGRADATWLDRAVPDRPVLLFANDYHTAWVNTAALGRAGIDRDTADPALGRILRRPDGTPSGMLVEAATQLVERLVAAPTAAVVAEGLTRGQRGGVENRSGGCQIGGSVGEERG